MTEILKNESRKDWTAPVGFQPTTEQLVLGCLQRIADATELMAKRHDELVRAKESAERSTEFWRDEFSRKERQLIAARGQITKMKNKAKATISTKEAA